MRRFNFAFLVIGFALFLWWAARSQPPHATENLGRFRLSPTATDQDLAPRLSEQAPLVEKYIAEAKAAVARSAGRTDVPAPDLVIVLADSSDPATQKILAPYLPGAARPEPATAASAALERTGKYYAGLLERGRLQKQLRPVNPKVALPPAVIVVIADGVLELFNLQ